MLTIGARKGVFPGMVANRVFNVRWISGPTANAMNFDAKPDQSVHYNGEAIEIHRTVAKAHARTKAHAPVHHRRHRRARK